MDYRRPLFQIEQWSPRLARRIWSLTSFLEVPLTLALGLKVNRLSDLDAEVEVPLNRLTRNESGEIHTSALLGAGEFAAKILWQRHLRRGFEEMHLVSIHGRFFKGAESAVKVRTQLHEGERERVLRKIHSGDNTEFDMPLIYIDKKDQHVASVNCVWSFKPLKPPALGPGQGVMS
jgi:uncharacterized protein DUF4442